MTSGNGCVKCGCKIIIRDVRVLDYGESNHKRTMTVATYRNPEAFLFKGEQRTDVTAYVCADCGYIEMYANSPRDLLT